MPKNELGETLAARLRRRRRELGLTQAQVAERMQVSQWTFLGWEKGTHQPTDRMYPAIIEFLGYEPWDKPETVGERLIAERRRRGLSIDRAAAVMGVDEGTLSGWESGEWTAYSQRCRQAVAAFLGPVGNLSGCR